MVDNWCRPQGLSKTQLRGISMSTDQPENGTNVSIETGATASTTSKLDAFGLTLLRWWGAIFRALFICAVGVIGWFWLDPQSISDLPLSQLTLKQIARNIFAVLLVDRKSTRLNSSH